MKKYNTPEEILYSFLKHLGRYKDNRIGYAPSYMVESFKEYNSLALGKPEPLAKNKAVIEFCKNCNSSNLVEEKIYRCKDCNCFHSKSGVQF